MSNEPTSSSRTRRSDTDYQFRSAPFPCPKCPSRFESKSSLTAHLKFHGGVKRTLPCTEDNCDYSVHGRKAFRIHQLTHAQYGEAWKKSRTKNDVLPDSDPGGNIPEEKASDEKIEEIQPPVKRKKMSEDPEPISQPPVLKEKSRTPQRASPDSPQLERVETVSIACDNKINMIELYDELCNNENNEETRFKIRQFLYKDSTPQQCSECPYKCSDPEILKNHMLFHSSEDITRPQKCTDCSFSTFTPTAIQHHLKVHEDKIPPGCTETSEETKYKCRNCGYKTMKEEEFIEHVTHHRVLLKKRMDKALKRKPPKEEYKRPKFKHLPYLAQKAEHCPKCSFKCASQNVFVAHFERHGWDQLYKCHLCDYSDNNKIVVDYHAENHHKDRSLQSMLNESTFRIENGMIQMPESIYKKPRPEEFLKISRNIIKCSHCEFSCHLASDLGLHISNNHFEEPGARETISWLNLGLMPPS